LTVPVQMILGADCSLSLGVGNPHRSLKTLGLTYVVFYSLIGCCLFDTFPISTYLPIFYRVLSIVPCGGVRILPRALGVCSYNVQDFGVCVRATTSHFLIFGINSNHMNVPQPHSIT